MKPRRRIVLACCFFGAAALCIVSMFHVGEVPNWWELGAAVLSMVAGTIQMQAENR
jgi:hypothetical protein